MCSSDLPGLISGSRKLRTDLFTDQQILALRGPKAVLDPQRAYAATWEEERDTAGALVPTAAIFLTNRECPFRCVMGEVYSCGTVKELYGLRAG